MPHVLFAKIYRSLLHQIVTVAEYVTCFAFMLYIRIQRGVEFLHTATHKTYEIARLRKGNEFRHGKHIVGRDFFFENTEVKDERIHI